MSTYELRKRAGMGPNIDPHLDAAAGRKASGRDLSWTGRAKVVSGYVELNGDRPWDDLKALLRAIHAHAPWPDELTLTMARGPAIPARPSWEMVRLIRYLTTDPECGIAIPMHSFMPSWTRVDRRGAADPRESHTPRETAEGVEEVIQRLDRQTGRKLGAARTIGLNVEFDLSRIDQSLGGVSDAHTLGPHRLGLAARCQPQLSTAMRQLRESPGSYALDYGITQTGKNTIIGIVDFGCDFAHPSFLDPQTKKSRLLALWDQNDGPTGDSPVISVAGEDFEFGYGRLFTRAAIDAALPAPGNGAPSDPYAALGYDPHAHHFTAKPPGDPAGPNGAHGTCVLEIAAGGIRAVGSQSKKARGVAPDADIVFVQLRLPFTKGRQDLDLGHVLDAVAFIFHQADKEGRPCVVNLSLNSMSGPHDGGSHFDWRLSQLLRSGAATTTAAGRSVVIAAGNLPDASAETVRWPHYAGTATASAPATFHWLMAPQDPSPNIVEIWYDAPAGALLQFTLITPDGDKLGPVEPGISGELMTSTGCCGSVSGSRESSSFDAHPPPGQVRQVMAIYLEVKVNAIQNWQVEVEMVPASAIHAAPPAGVAVRFDAWLARDDGCPSGLCRAASPVSVAALDRDCTVGTLSCGNDAIVVGAYSSSGGVASGWSLSGRGPDRRTAKKPDIAAPGQDLWLIRSRGEALQEPLMLDSGTSMAAPFVTGTIACIYEARPRATLAEVRAALTLTAQPLPGQAAGWTAELGAGVLDIRQALAHVASMPPSP